MTGEIIKEEDESEYIDVKEEIYREPEIENVQGWHSAFNIFILMCVYCIQTYPPPFFLYDVSLCCQ